MKSALLIAASGLAGLLLAGCATPIPPGAERGPDHTMAFDILVEASSPDVKIEANGQIVGTAPVHIKVFGDPEGKFHDFGSYYYAIRAFPAATNQFAQARYYRTGRWGTPHDRIPEKINFDVSHPPLYPPAPLGYYYPPPYYYGPPYWYGPPYYYYGPYWGPRPFYHRRW